MKAAIHLGPNYVEILEVHRITNFAILNVTTKDWTAPSWTRTTLTHDQVITLTKAKVRLYSDSVLCLGKMSDHSEANRRWRNQVKKFNSPNLTENYVVLMENRLSSSGIFPRTYVIGTSAKDLENLQDRCIEPENFEDRIISVPMFNDIE